MSHGTRYGIIHNIQAGISINNDFIGRHLNQVRQQFLGFLNTVDNAVISAVNTLTTL